MTTIEGVLDSRDEWDSWKFLTYILLSSCKKLVSFRMKSEGFILTGRAVDWFVKNKNKIKQNKQTKPNKSITKNPTNYSSTKNSASVV